MQARFARRYRCARDPLHSTECSIAGTVRSAIVQNKIMCGSGMTEAARLALAIARFDCTQ